MTSCWHLIACDKKSDQKRSRIKNGFFNTLAHWTSVMQVGSDPAASWSNLTSLPTNPSTNYFVIPFPAPPPSSGGYALFQTPLTAPGSDVQVGFPASGVLYQEITPTCDQNILSFDWFALSGTSSTALSRQGSMDLKSTPNFQFRVDIVNRSILKQPSSAWFTSPSDQFVLENLVAPSVTAGAQLDSTGSVVIAGWQVANFNLEKWNDKRVLLAFRAVSAAPAFPDVLLAAVANVRWIKLEKVFGSGFKEPLNGYAAI